jgi:lipopolysaccharide/colanic/teichoic acid biosynthesis glycosyltransferase
MPRVYERFGKRALDVAGALAMSAVAAPVMGVIAAVLWRTQGRPILFTQARVGKDDVDFTIYKFRTMVPNAAGQGAGLWFEPNDSRVTPVGRVLRSTSLDELPQVWNVLRGDMSLVGPRPKPRELIERYRSHYEPTLRVKPGLTHLPAVSGRNTLRRSQMIALDVEYARRVSLRADLRILALTVPVVLLRKGFHAPDESEAWVEDVPSSGPIAT